MESLIVGLNNIDRNLHPPLSNDFKVDFFANFLEIVLDDGHVGSDEISRALSSMELLDDGDCYSGGFLESLFVIFQEKKLGYRAFRDG